VIDWKNHTEAFESVAAVQDFGFTLTRTGNDTERFPGRAVSANFFSTLSVAPSLGRDFVPEDDRAGAEPVAILSHHIWQRAFAADPQIIGRTVTLNGRDFTIVGILPATFRLYTSGEIFAPIGLGLRRSVRGQREGSTQSPVCDLPSHLRGHKPKPIRSRSVSRWIIRTPTAEWGHSFFRSEPASWGTRDHCSWRSTPLSRLCF
jgi:hypothetical protein